MNHMKKLTAVEELQVEIRVQELLPYLFTLGLDTESAWALAHNVSTVFYGTIHHCATPKELLQTVSLQKISKDFESILQQDQGEWTEEFTTEVKDFDTP